MPITTKTLWTGLAAVVALAWLAAPASALDLGYGKYIPTKDEPTNGQCWAEFVNMGANEYAFIKAGVATWQADFDRDAIAAVLAAWPQHEVRLYITTADSDDPSLDERFMPYTWQSQSVWGAEGDGYWDLSGQLTWNDYGDPLNYNSHAFNWTAGTQAICQWGICSHLGTGVVDTANSQHWLDAAGNPIGNPCSAFGGPPAGSDPTGWCQSKMECCWGAFDSAADSKLLNSEPIIGLGDMVQAWVKLDQELVEDITGTGRANVFALGVALADENNDIWTNWNNLWMCTKENEGNEPYIRLMWPGDANFDGCANGADYTLWADNYQLNPGGQGWEEADFNGDMNTDGGDYTLWADHYVGGTGGPGCTGTGQIPEPVTLGLLSLGAVALLRRK